jgi:hypothetical protein
MTAADGILGMTRALDFAARRHASQRRKGLKAEPYINHLTEVALLLAEATGGADPVLIIAGLLLRSLMESPPVGWSARKKREYVSWAREVVAACGPTNDFLERLFTETADSQLRLSMSS